MNVSKLIKNQIANLKIGERIKFFFSNLNDNGITALWAAAVLLCAVLLWALSANSRNGALAKKANAVLQARNESVLLFEHVRLRGVNAKAEQAVVWFSIYDGAWSREEGANNRLAVIFPIFYYGVFENAVAVYSTEGVLEKIVPLTKRAAFALEDSNPAYLNFLKARLAGTVVQVKNYINRNVSGKGGQ